MKSELQRELALLGQMTNELKRLDASLVARYSTHAAELAALKAQVA